jgi:glucose/arabinose dehydrogenase
MAWQTLRRDNLVVDSLGQDQIALLDGVDIVDEQIEARRMPPRTTRTPCYRPGETRITDKGTKLLDLPAGHNWTRALLASKDGTKLFITVGSGSNIGEKGMDIEKDRATILELDIASGKSRIFASGLRNANGMVFGLCSDSM